MTLKKLRTAPVVMTLTISLSADMNTKSCSVEWLIRLAHFEIFAQFSTGVSKIYTCKVYDILIVFTDVLLLVLSLTAWKLILLTSRYY
jgi:hypothetical protein